MQSIIDNNSIRLFLLDRPELNTLINGTQFSEPMINQAILLTVDRYNTIPPPGAVTFSVEKMPFLYLTLLGVSAYLLKSASIGDSRNMLTYSANGINISDRDKAQIYISLAKQFDDEFMTLATNIKLNMNLSGCYGNVNSEYAYRYYL